jgi:transcriptional regulator with XRE-family HTH domain
LTLKFRHAFGEAVREQRLAKRLTLRDVSAKGLVSIGHLSDIERGVKQASSYTIECIANGLAIESYTLIIEAGYRMTAEATYVPDTPESLFIRNPRWVEQYSDLVI